MDRVIALKQISVTALFYLEDSRRIHPGSARARQPKVTKRREWRSAPARGGGREREKALWLLFLCFFLPPGPALCKLGLVRSAVLPEVLTLVLGPSFDLLLFYFRGLFPSLSFSHRRFGLL